MSARYIKSLDGVRALALLLIMTYHAGLFHFTWVSVQLFFVLSGYLITGILWEEKMKPASVGFKYKKFLVRRSLRIFPLYLGYLFILGMTFLFFNFPTYYTTYFPYLITYTFNYTRLLEEWQGNPLFTHLWTLSIEEQFYLLFPIVIFFTPKKFIRYFLTALIIIAPVCRLLLGEWYKGLGIEEGVIADAVYWNTLSHLDAFCMGGIIPVLSLDRKIRQPAKWLFWSIVIFLTAGAISYVYSTSTYPYYNDFGYHHWLIGNYQHVWHYTLINLCCAALILVLVSPYSQQSIPLTRKFLEHPWIVRIGKVSYGMYVFHWLVLVYLFERYLMPDHLLGRFLLFIPYVAAVYLLAELSFSFYEARFIRLKDKFFKDRSVPSKLSSTTETLPGI
ncbi:MAG: acyltransferase [Flavisolibacter sp.]|jgi:peptidoglycan/LPS O-acetylase OafA/YrhL|nr:acyltransferase [Flavisolibacter sp.]